MGILAIFVIVIGIAFIGVWVYRNPQILGRMGIGLQQAESEVRRVQTMAVAPSRPVTAESTIDQQVLDLRKGEIVSIDPSGSQSVTALDHIIGCVGMLIALNRSGQEYRPNGDTYTIFETDEPQNNILVLRRPDFWLLLTEQEIMEGESIKQFDSLGDLWGDKDHRQQTDEEHKVELPWKGEKWAMVDEGYMDFQLNSGSGHLSDGVRIKYYIAAIGNRVMYVEHVKSGTNRVWSGTKTPSLNGYVTKVLRKSA